jgi:hypothetical protein
MRYECDDAAFAGDFVEFSDSWSRAQVRATWIAPDPKSGQTPEEAEERLLACLRPKILAIHLTCVDAPAIVAAEDLTVARTEQIDTRLYQWFASLWVVHLNNLANLGNVLGRTLFVISAPIATMEAALPNLNHS